MKEAAETLLKAHLRACSLRCNAGTQEQAATAHDLKMLGDMMRAVLLQLAVASASSSSPSYSFPIILMGMSIQLLVHLQICSRRA